MGNFLMCDKNMEGSYSKKRDGACMREAAAADRDDRANSERDRERTPRVFLLTLFG